MVLAGLDISKSVTGWAVFNGMRWDSGAWRCPIKKPFHLEAGRIDAEYAGEVAWWFSKKVHVFVKKHKPDRVAIEQPLPGMGGATSFDVTHFLHGLAFEACRICSKQKSKSVYVASQTWRSTLGVGTPPKEKLVGSLAVALTAHERRAWYKQRSLEVCAQNGVMVSGNDEADAVCLTLHLRARLNPATSDLFSVVA